MEYDLNNDGYIDASEIREKKPDIDVKSLSIFFWQHDTNEDGRISLKEYTKEGEVEEAPTQ